MNATLASDITALKTLRADAFALLRTSDGLDDMNEWTRIRKAAGALFAEVKAEEARILAAHPDSIEAELAVLGHARRRHTDPCVVRYCPERGVRLQ